MALTEQILRYNPIILNMSFFANYNTSPLLAAAHHNCVRARCGRGDTVYRLNNEGLFLTGEEQPSWLELEIYSDVEYFNTLVASIQIEG